jgi:iron complex transport system substrate-binding protein
MSRVWIFLSLLVLLFALTGLLTWGVGVPDTLLARPDGKAEVHGEGFPKKLTDSFGYRFTLAQPPKRIISAMLASDEILLDLVSRERIAVVSSYATDPANSNCVEKAHGIPTVTNLAVEDVLALKPDLILTARFTSARVITQLRQCQMPIFCIGRFDSLQDIRENVLLVGAAVGEETRAEKIVGWMEQVLHEVKNRVAGADKKPRVLYYYLRATAGKGTIFDEMVQVAGGVNVAAEAGIHGFKSISAELIPAMAPEVVIVPYSGEKVGATLEELEPGLLKDPIWQYIRSLDTVEEFGLPQRHLGCISHHVVKAAAGLAHLLHPKRVPDKLTVAAHVPAE